MLSRSGHAAKGRRTEKGEQHRARGTAWGSSTYVQQHHACFIRMQENTFAYVREHIRICKGIRFTMLNRTTPVSYMCKRTHSHMHLYMYVRIYICVYVYVYVYVYV